MVQDTQRAKKILEWREAIAGLDDETFFSIMRIYLGDLKSPFNKQKLIEELGAFIRNEENKAKIASLLTDCDIEILSAVKFIPKPTAERLEAFFQSELTSMQLAQRIHNLVERLLIFPKTEGEKTVYAINPHLAPVISGFLSKQSLSGDNACVSEEEGGGEPVNPLVLGAMVSFIEDNRDPCKADGFFKKRAIAVLEEIFGREPSPFLVRAMINCNLVKKDDSGLQCDFGRLSGFAKLDMASQLSYLCAAGCGSPGGYTHSKAQHLMDMISAIPESGMTKTAILRQGILNSSSSLGSESRFSQLLYSVQKQDAENAEVQLLDAAAEIGLLRKIGVTKSGEAVFVRAASEEKADGSPKISIDAGYTVTVLPGLSLSEILPLAQFLQIRKCGTVATFEATRASVGRGFDHGFTPQSIFDTLSKFTPHPLPQTLVVTIEEWYKTYNSASIYRGYVLKLSEGSKIYSQKNPRLKRYIDCEIAPGIFLMNFSSDFQARAVLSNSGIESAGAVKTVNEYRGEAHFSPLYAGSNSYGEDKSKASAQEEEPAPKRMSDEERKEFFAALIAKANSLGQTKNITESLIDRVRRSLVVDAAQLRPDSVKLEITEAFGMDYAGKVHLVEQAMSQDSPVEFTYENESGVTERILGKPAAIERRASDTFVRLTLIPSNEEKRLSVGHALKIRRVRG